MRCGFLFSFLFFLSFILFAGCAEMSSGASQTQKPAESNPGNFAPRRGGRDFNGLPPDWNNADFNGRPPRRMDENLFMQRVRQAMGLPQEATVLEVKQALGLPETASMEELRMTFFEKFGKDFNRERRFYNE
ncbi:MAG: hypothetical protein QXK06_05160 [Candidatus Diapherotrites archaeon]